MTCVCKDVADDWEHSSIQNDFRCSSIGTTTEQNHELTFTILTSINS